MAMSPTQRTLDRCRRNGWTACVVEKWIPHTQQRKDAFGFGDVLAVDPRRTGAILIQATTASNVSSRAAKIAAECSVAALAWLRANNEILIWGWRRVDGRWFARSVVVTEADLKPEKKEDEA